MKWNINQNEIIKETNKEYNPNKPEIQKEQIWNTKKNKYEIQTNLRTINQPPWPTRPIQSDLFSAI